MTATQDAAPPPEALRHRSLPARWQWLVIALAVIAVGLAVNQIFNLGFFSGRVILDNQYLFLLTTALLPLVFLLFPAHGTARDTIPWYDYLLFLLTATIGIYLTWYGVTAIEEGWEYLAPTPARIAAFVLWGLLIEGVRRSGGLALTVIVVTFSLYPVFADRVPGPIQGFPQPLWDIAPYYAFSTEAAFGIPMKALGKLVVGFVIFGVALQHTGAGKFFIDFALALLGHVRGGAAKVSIFSSGLLGSMSGSVITNVLTTGVLTIPTMKRTGFSKDYAAGVEACASTGGVLMPPVMGATAFVMASFLNVPYIDVAVAAVIPSLLYYLGLFLQIDAYAARNRLRGLPREDLPRLGTVLAAGWHYVFALALLIWMLLALKREAMAPFYATLLLLITNQIFGHRLSLAQFKQFLFDMGRLLAELVALLAAIGLIVGALVVTGLAGTVATDLILLAGGNIYILLLMGAATSFVLGMGMTVTAAYIFLAIVLAPSLVQAGLDPLAVHLFILYWGMLSFITPPVALGAFAAATLSGSNPMQAGFAAMKLGSIIYFIPFFFVLNPALILQGAPLDIIIVLASCLPGVLLIAGATQGYLPGYGELGGGWLGGGVRLLLFCAGLLFAFPGHEGLGVSHWQSVLGGMVAALAGLLLDRLTKWRRVDQGA